MTTSQTHVRPNRRQHTPSRPSGPALTQRQSHNASNGRVHRTTSSKGKTDITVESLDDDEDSSDAMAHTFLQYCAVCDNQILVPSSSILYCSETCRQTDANSSPSYTIFKNDSMPPPPAKSTIVIPPQPRDVVLQLSPTVTNHRPVFTTQSSTESSTSDSDSASASCRGRSHISTTSRSDSEATRYLNEFHSDNRPVSWTRYSRSSGNVTPLLSTTPTSSASASIPYTPLSSLAPLPPRNTRWSHTSSSSRSVDLITPINYYYTAPLSLATVTGKSAGSSIEDRSATPTPAIGCSGGDGMSYEKRKTISGSIGHGSLKQLFKFDEMRSIPTSDEYCFDHTVI